MAHRRRSGKKLLGAKSRGSSGWGTRGERKYASKSKSSKGPSGEQQKYLAALCRQHGLKYPAPKTSREASRMIESIKATGSYLGFEDVRSIRAEQSRTESFTVWAEALEARSHPAASDR